MPSTNTVLPPHVVLSQATVYASQGSIYALDASSGAVRQSYSIRDLVSPTIVDDILYLNISCHPDYLVQALHVSDGSLLWSFRVEGRLTDAPVIVDEVVYVSVVEGTIYALQARDGTLLWHSTIDLGPDVPNFLGPIVFASPTIVDEVVYLAPAVNLPLQPYVYAFQAKDGTLLWKAQIADSTSFPLVVADGVLYISTYNGCSALRANDGSPIWHHETQAQICSSPIVVNGVVYTSLFEISYNVAPSVSDEISHRHQAFLCARQASDGSFLWQQPLGGGAGHPTAPLVTQNAIYVGADNGSLSTFQRSDGTPLWHYQTGGTFLSSPMGASGIVYVGANDGSVYALRASDGALLWQTFVSVAISVVSGLSVSAGEIHFLSEP